LTSIYSKHVAARRSGVSSTAISNMTAVLHTPLIAMPKLDQKLNGNETNLVCRLYVGFGEVPA
jgi:hypothetical protein